MNPKTKTASLILQKVPLKQRSNPESKHSIVIDIESKVRPIIETPKNQVITSSNKKLALQHLSHYDTFSLTFQPEISTKSGQQGSSKLLGSQEYCQLERQNYRLIETNFNLLSKLAAMVEKFRDQCLKIVQYIEQYHYVLAIQVVYQLIDMLRNIDTSSCKDVRDSVMFGVKCQPTINVRKQSEQKPENKQARIIKQFQVCPPEPHNSSIVEEYSLRNSKRKVEDHRQLDPPQKSKKVLQICPGVTFASYEPPQPIRNQHDYILQQETPYFSLDDSRFKRNSLDVFHGHAGDRTHQRLMMTSLERLGFSSRVESVAGDGTRKLFTQSVYAHAELREQQDRFDNFSQQRHKLKPLSEKNITIFKGSNKKSIMDQSQSDELYRCLFVQACTIQELFSS